jgi:hypothetical protein
MNELSLAMTQKNTTVGFGFEAGSEISTRERVSIAHGDGANLCRVIPTPFERTDMLPSETRCKLPFHALTFLFMCP